MSKLIMKKDTLLFIVTICFLGIGFSHIHKTESETTIPVELTNIHEIADSIIPRTEYHTEEENFAANINTHQ